MIPDRAGWWWYRIEDNPQVPWIPKFVDETTTRVAGVPAGGRGELLTVVAGQSVGVGTMKGQWGERLYAPSEYPRYHRITGEPVARTETSANGRINVDFDRDGCVVGLEVLHAEGGK